MTVQDFLILVFDALMPVITLVAGWLWFLNLRK